MVEIYAGREELLDLHTCPMCGERQTGGRKVDLFAVHLTRSICRQCASAVDPGLVAKLDRLERLFKKVEKHHPRSQEIIDGAYACMAGEHPDDVVPVVPPAQIEAARNYVYAQWREDAPPW